MDSQAEAWDILDRTMDWICGLTMDYLLTATREPYPDPLDSFIKTIFLSTHNICFDLEVKN